MLSYDETGQRVPEGYGHECPVIIVTLRRSADRRTAIGTQFNSLGLAYTFYEGVDGRELTKDVLEAVAPRGGIDYCGLLTPAEIGCSLSHLGVIEKIAKGDAPYTAVFEDDVLISADVHAFLQPELLRSLPPFDVLRLSGAEKAPRFTLKVAELQNHRIIAVPKCRLSMCALVYSREGATKILEKINNVTAPIDNMIFHDRRPFALRVLEIEPPVAYQDTSVASEIGQRLGPADIRSIVHREFRRARNWLRLWMSFSYQYGAAGLLRLRRP